MRRGPKSKYKHLLRAMRPGDVLYLPEHIARLDRQISSTIGRDSGKASTHNFIAVGQDPASAHRIVRITMLKAMKS